MGLRGPAPTPTKILKFRGSKHATDGRKNEPTPPTGEPDCPKTLTRQEKAIWKRLCTDLLSVRVVSTIDWSAVERFAISFNRWRQVERAIKELAGEDKKLLEVLESPQKRAVLKSMWQESARLNDELRHTEAQFGLTPASRARVKAADASPVTAEDADAARVIGL